MRKKPEGQVYQVALYFGETPTGMKILKKVYVKASTREIAERRAIKRNPAAVAIVRSENA